MLSNKRELVVFIRTCNREYCGCVLIVTFLGVALVEYVVFVLYKISFIFIRVYLGMFMQTAALLKFPFNCKIDHIYFWCYSRIQ